MNFFDGLMELFRRKRGFDFHPNCQEIKLTNVWLKPNLKNSSVYFAGNVDERSFEWCSWQTVFLPQLVIKEINGVLKNFLWHGKCDGMTGAKVKWKDINVKKKEGGLDLKDIGEWNKACMAKHLWNICIGKDTLWIRWLHSYRLKGVSIWGVQWRSIDTNTWCKLLSLRGEMRPLRSIQLLRVLKADSVAEFLKRNKWPSNRLVNDEIRTCIEGMPRLDDRVSYLTVWVIFPCSVSQRGCYVEVGSLLETSYRDGGLLITGAVCYVENLRTWITFSSPVRSLATFGEGF
ncbi:hypothetical protein LIER_07828 [Lithospermum erythrorhizon]|uniref:Uncharacterized protein n=1 Tax=Lithospermum erythrorhizon TaxID=34254 RepID=A0AAV3PAZ5_LITER